MSGPDTVGGAFVQALAPDQYAAYADRVAERDAAAQPLPEVAESPITFEFADADGDLLTIGRPAFPAGGTPSVSIYTPSHEPVHVPVEQVPEVIVALGRLAGITQAPLLTNAERSLLLHALELTADAMAATPCDYSPEDEASLAALRKLAGGAS